MFSDLQTEHTQLLYDEGTYQALVDHRRVGNTNNSSRELDLKTYDAAFLIMSILFIFIGSCGVFANGRSLCLFFPTDIVSQILLKILLFTHYDYNMSNMDLILNVCMFFLDQESREPYCTQHRCEWFVYFINWDFRRRHGDGRNGRYIHAGKRHWAWTLSIRRLYLHDYRYV